MPSARYRPAQSCRSTLSVPRAKTQSKSAQIPRRPTKPSKTKQNAKEQEMKQKKDVDSRQAGTGFEIGGRTLTYRCWIVIRVKYLHESDPLCPCTIVATGQIWSILAWMSTLVPVVLTHQKKVSPQPQQPTRWQVSNLVDEDSNQSIRVSMQQPVANQKQVDCLQWQW